MRGAALLLATFAVGVILAPGVPFGRVFDADLAAIDGEATGAIDIDRLPVTLVDLTGLVTSIEEDHGAVRFDDTSTPILQYAGDPVALRIFWLGGACTARARIWLGEGRAAGNVFLVDEETSLGGMIGCAALGVPRRVLVRFSRPVDPLAFRVSYDAS